MSKKYSKKDLIKFTNFVLKERKEKETLTNQDFKVWHSDLENWKETKKGK